MWLERPHQSISIQLMCSVNSNTPARGILLILLAATLWGVGYPFWKVLALKASPLGLTAASFCTSAIIMYLYDRKPLWYLREEFRKAPLVITLLGISAGLCGTGLCFLSLRHLDAGIVSFVEKLQAAFVIIFGWMILGEVLPRRRIPLVVLTLLLACLLSAKTPLELSELKFNYAGLAAGVGCAAFYGANVVMYKYLSCRGVGSDEIAFFRMCFGGISVVPVLLLSDGELRTLFQLTLSDYALLFGLIVTSVVIAFKLFVKGIQHTSATTAAILELVTPIVSIFISSLFFDEDVSRFQLVIIPCYLLCILALSLPQSKRKQAGLHSTLG